MSTLGNKKIELFDMGAGPSAEPTADENVQMASGESLCLLFSATIVPTHQEIDMSEA